MKAFAEESLIGIRSLFSIITRLALWHKPSLVVLDNLHQFAGMETEVWYTVPYVLSCAHRKQHTDSFKSTQVAEILLNFMSQLSRHLVAILATTESMAALHKRLATGHVFSKVVSIRPPDKHARSQVGIYSCVYELYEPFFNTLQMLKLFVDTLRSTSSIETDISNYTALATTTEGYSPQDLYDLTRRALHKATIRASKEGETKVVLSMADYESAQNGYTPLSIRDVKLQKSEVEWADIGGRGFILLDPRFRW